MSGCNHRISSLGKLHLQAILLVILLCAPMGRAAVSTEDEKPRLLTAEGKVEVALKGGAQWTPGRTNQLLAVGDQVRTGLRSRAAVRLSDLTVLRLRELTTIEI